MDQYETVRGLPQKGGFGEIFIVRKKADKKAGPTYVMKRARLAKCSDEDKQRLHNEVTVHRSIQRGLEDQHEGIVRFIESFSDRKVFGCIVLEHCKGGDLASKLNMASKKEQIIPEMQCLDWFAQITSAVEYMHVERVLHRDLKLANCFLTGGDDPIVKVGDFGLACQLPEDVYCAEEKCGTITAMSPELILNGWGTYKSDVWALGTILYELATHGPVFEVPFDSFGLDIRRYKAAMSRPIKPIPDHYSRAMRGLVEAVLTTEMDDRPIATQVMEMLQDWPTKAPEPLERKERRIDRVGSKVNCGPIKQKAADGEAGVAPAPAPPLAKRKEPVVARQAKVGGNDPGGVMRKAKKLAAAEVPPTETVSARRSAARESVADRLSGKPKAGSARAARGGGGAAEAKRNSPVDEDTPRFGRRAPVVTSARTRSVKSAGPVRSPSKVGDLRKGANAPGMPPAAKTGRPGAPRRPNSATVKGSPPAVREEAKTGRAARIEARTAAASLVNQAGGGAVSERDQAAADATAKSKEVGLEAARQRAQLAVKKIGVKSRATGSAKSRPTMGNPVECWFESQGIWRTGEVSKTEGPRLWCKVQGVGDVGPFHRALDRNSLWRPLAPAQEARMLRPVCASADENEHPERARRTSCS